MRVWCWVVVGWVFWTGDWVGVLVARMSDCMGFSGPWWHYWAVGNVTALGGSIGCVTHVPNNQLPELYGISSYENNRTTPARDLEGFWGG